MYQTAQPRRGEGDANARVSQTVQPPSLRSRQSCGDEISEKRLRALPFAVRCKGCEEAREAVDERARQLVRTRERSPLLFDMSG
jgi:hypothetical protein